MPAPRPVIHEIDELQLSHKDPWTTEKLRDHHRRKQFQDEGWYLVARGSSIIKKHGKIVNRSEEVDTFADHDGDDYNDG